MFEAVQTFGSDGPSTQLLSLAMTSFRNLEASYELTRAVYVYGSTFANFFFNISKATLFVARFEAACLRRLDILPDEDCSVEVDDMFEGSSLELGREVRGVDLRDFGCRPEEISIGSSSSFFAVV